MLCSHRLCLVADRSRIVLADDPAAAFLYAIPGQNIPDSDAVKFGLVNGTIKPKEKPAEIEERQTRVINTKRTR